MSLEVRSRLLSSDSQGLLNDQLIQNLLNEHIHKIPLETLPIQIFVGLKFVNRKALSTYDTYL